MSKASSLAEVVATSSGDGTDDLAGARALRARQCAQELANLAGRYTELARHLKKPIADIMREAGRTTASDRDLILSALSDNCHTYGQIAEWTNLPYHTVYKLVNQSPLLHLVEFRENPPLGERGRGGHRRPEILIFLRHGDF